ncbi:MAG: 2-C-methyl-D-erythritol 2,4-cyclodiphosphate synthase, partial [Puniceicoccales bacterium]|nr:2-C-methyl-D-erythritol 2,4-cyclodiphosphate synthase [Puniceicoccales bacterium]
MMRVGIGRDLHRLEMGRSLILGGIKIDSELGCVAHSDGDCLLHSIMDSILGALARPNIGVLFPNDDERNRNRSSVEMLAAVVNRMKEARYVVGNLDATIILERPMLSQHMEKMRKNVAECIGAQVMNVSIKATTNEKVIRGN